MFLFLLLRPPRPTLFPYTTLFRSAGAGLLAVPRALPSPLVPVPRGWFAPSAPAQAAQPMPTTARGARVPDSARSSVASATIRGDTVLTALTPIVWGTTYLVTSELLPPGHPLFAALMRALPAGLLALLLARTLPRGAWWWRSLVLGTLNIGAFFPLLFIAAEELPGGVAATLAAIQPLVIALLAVVVLAEPPSWGRILWGLAGVAGVALVVLGPGAGLSLLGVVAGLLGASATALGIVLTKHWGQPVGVGPMGFAGWQLTAGGLVMLLLSAAFVGAHAR